MTRLVTSVVAEQPLRSDVRARPSFKTACMTLSSAARPVWSRPGGRLRRNARWHRHMMAPANSAGLPIRKLLTVRVVVSPNGSQTPPEGIARRLSVPLDCVAPGVRGAESGPGRPAPTSGIFRAHQPRSATRPFASGTNPPAARKHTPAPVSGNGLNPPPPTFRTSEISLSVPR